MPVNFNLTKKHQFGCDWSPHGSFLLVTGTPTIYFIRRGTWRVEKDNTIGHKKESTLVQWLSDDLFATTGLDNTLKVFSLMNKRLEFFAELSKSQQSVAKVLSGKKSHGAQPQRVLNQIAYVKEAKTILMSDYEGAFCFMHYDFENKQHVQLP